MQPQPHMRPHLKSKLPRQEHRDDVRRARMATLNVKGKAFCTPQSMDPFRSNTIVRGLCAIMDWKKLSVLVITECRTHADSRVEFAAVHHGHKYFFYIFQHVGIIIHEGTEMSELLFDQSGRSSESVQNWPTLLLNQTCPF